MPQPRRSSCRITSIVGGGAEAPPYVLRRRRIGPAKAGHYEWPRRYYVRRGGLVVLVIAIAAAVAAAVLYERTHALYRGFSAMEQFVEIPAGAGTRAIGDRLVAAGVIRDRLTYRAALWLTGHARHLKAGEYRFDEAMTPVDVVSKIARGEVYVISVTFREGLTIAEMAAVFEAHGLGARAAFVAAAQ